MSVTLTPPVSGISTASFSGSGLTHLGSTRSMCLIKLAVVTVPDHRLCQNERARSKQKQFVLPEQ